MKLFVNALLMSIILPHFAFNQNDNYIREKPSIEIKKARNAIKVDGIIDEVDWEEAQQTSRFHQMKPYDSSLAVLQTEVKLTFDDKNLYVYAKCFEPKNLITISSLKRDFEGGSSDVFAVNIDTFKDRLNGFQFAVSPYNVQREGLIVNTD